MRESVDPFVNESLPYLTDRIGHRCRPDTSGGWSRSRSRGRSRSSRSSRHHLRCNSSGGSTAPKEVEKPAAIHATLFQQKRLNDLVSSNHDLNTGASGRVRSDDIQFTKLTLCQLSYAGEMVAPVGLQPTTFRVRAGCSEH